jgi:hypothetical protein
MEKKKKSIFSAQNAFIAAFAILIICACVAGATDHPFGVIAIIGGVLWLLGGFAAYEISRKKG